MNPFRTLWRVATSIIRLSGSHRKLWLPFLVAASAEIILLGILWLAPHPPYSKILAPPIRYFFGDRVLHYPIHLWFLYHAMKHTHLIASIVIGAFMSGIACVMIRQSYDGTPLSFREALVSRQARYRTIVIVWFVICLAAKGAMGLTTRAVSHSNDQLLMWVGLSVMLGLQVLLAYAIPAVVFDRCAWWKALLQSIQEALRFPFSTLVVIGIPSAMVIGFAMVAPPVQLARWMVRTAPEIAILWIAMRLLVWMLADVIMTVGVAHLWCLHRQVGCQPESATITPVATTLHGTVPA